MSLLALLVCFAGVPYAQGEVQVDPSAEVSIAYKFGEWKVYPSVLPWTAHDSSVIAVATFANTQQEDGWMKLEVQTKEQADDELQARAAGIAEGFLTRTYILEQYKEFYSNDVCSRDPDLCDWVFQRIRQNMNFAKEQASLKKAEEPYWYQVHLFYEQLDGIRQGYTLNSNLNDLDDTGMNAELGVLLLNFIADFWDMVEQYNTIQASKVPEPDSSQVKFGDAPSRPSCSVMIKHLPDQNELFFAHNTWHEYRAMAYRLLKNYRIPVHTLPDRKEVVPGHTISMSSYAGVLMSLDDFYLTSAGLATTETTLFIYNKDLLKDLPIESVYEPLRVMTANRLATTGQEWADIFKQYNSGTYNNEWMIVDYNLFKESPKDLKDGVFTVLEQVPGLVVIEDQTSVLRNTTYWGSYNRAFYPEIQRLTGTLEKVDEFGSWFTHDNTNRANIMRRDHKKISDMSTLMDFMRYNDFENDEFGTVEGCQPAANPAGAISNRLDLVHVDAKCAFDDIDWMVVRSGYGALDAKLASSASFPGLEFTAVAGPTRGKSSRQYPAFSWSQTTLETKPAFRPIDKFDFEPVLTSWGLNGGSISSSSVGTLALLQTVLKAIQLFRGD